MHEQAKEIKAFIMENVANNPSHIVKLAMAKFSVTSMTVHRHLHSLIKNNLLIKTGNTRGAMYFLRSSSERLKEYVIANAISSGVEEDHIFKDFEDIFNRFPKNIREICHFGVTEILNNAIEHSRGSKIILETRFSEPNLSIIIKDDGVGVYKTICDYLHIDDVREGILHLSKGKITRDPINHTGQGIFFTSRMFDTFSIDANGYVYTKDNKLQDWTLMQRHGSRGSEITMRINVHSNITCKEVFSAYEGEEFAFNKTEILVHLADFNETDFVSRSQAKRILLGLEKFSLITFDFKKVGFVGQGFADEIFRVFKNRHPSINLQYINAVEAIRFMIERSIKPT